jgi:hypothetical protein
MAKITRKVTAQFADVSPTSKLAQFGSKKAGAISYSVDPDTIQALAAFGQGFASSLINSGPPAIQEIDALFNLLTRQIRYLDQMSVPEWDAATTYFVGSLVQSDGDLYISVVIDNLNFAVTNTAKWMLYKSIKVKDYTSDIIMPTSDDSTIRVIASSGSYPVLFLLPTPSSANIGRVLVVKKMFNAGAGDMQFQAEDSSSIDGVTIITVAIQYTVKKFISTGTNWEVIT